MSKRDDAVRARAVRDLPCPATSIEVTHFSRDAYRARGCDKEIMYKCGLQLNGKFTCNR